MTCVSWKWLIIEQNRRKIQTNGANNCICNCTFMCDLEFSLESFSAVCKYLIWKFSKGCSSHSCRPIWTKLYGNYGNQGSMHAIFFGDLPNFTNLCHFEDITSDTVCTKVTSWKFEISNSNLLKETRERQDPTSCLFCS